MLVEKFISFSISEIVKPVTEICTYVTTAK